MSNHKQEPASRCSHIPAHLRRTMAAEYGYVLLEGGLEAEGSLAQAARQLGLRDGEILQQYRHIDAGHGQVYLLLKLEPAAEEKVGIGLSEARLPPGIRCYLYRRSLPGEQ